MFSSMCANMTAPLVISAFSIRMKEIWDIDCLKFIYIGQDEKKIWA